MFTHLHLHGDRAIAGAAWWSRYPYHRRLLPKLINMDQKRADFCARHVAWAQQPGYCQVV